MKVLLITTPAITFRSGRDINPIPPMGLGYLAAVVERMGVDVGILDCLMEGWEREEVVDTDFVRVGLSNEDIIGRVRAFEPDVVGVSCQFSRQHRVYHELFSLIKRARPGAVVVAGGAHATVCPHEVLSDPCCDYVLLGEAEKSFEEFIQFVQGKRTADGIDGLGWKSTGIVNVREKATVIADLDSIPFPAYHLMSLPKYHGFKVSHGARHKEKFCPVVTSRGCPAKCVFCSASKVWGRRFRSRSVENVIAEMRYLKDVHGVEELMFEDDNVTADPKRAKALFARMIEEGLGFVWDTPNGVGVWSLDEEMITLMKKSGCMKLNFPVESGSQRVLDEVVRKPLKLKRVRNLVRYSKSIGLDCGMFLVIGLPGEKMKDIWESFRFAASCGCFDPHISIATPYPGTDLLDECIKGNHLSRAYSLDDLFIRSFIIQTDDWNGDDLRRTLLKGRLYLLLRNVMRHPIRALNRIVRKICFHG